MKARGSSAKWAVLVAALAGAASAEPAAGGEAVERLDLAGLPILSYDSDTGLGLGADLALFWRHPASARYRLALRAQAFFTTGGVQNHYLQLDAPRVAGTPFRLSLELGFFRDLFRPFYGFGNGLAVLPEGDPAWRDGYYAYELTSPRASFAVRYGLGGRWHLEAGYGYQRLLMKAGGESLLALQRPTGWDGGGVGQLELALLFDGRDVEASPTGGLFAKAGFRAAHAVLGASSAFAGGYAILAGYHSPFGLGPALVLAGRLTADLDEGAVPLPMLSNMAGGPNLFEGLGGQASVRGLPRYRYLGKAKLLANAELRSRVLRLRPFDRAADLWLVAFSDAGRVWAQLAEDGPLWRFHLAWGGGLRLAFVEDFVLRIDLGRSEGSTGFYVELNQLF